MPRVIGAILAGGRGRRMGGGKPARELAGRPLVAWPAAALAEACERVVVVAKADVELPALPGVERWDEPDAEPHPAHGIRFALERAGEPVLVCAADMPFVTADACRSLVSARRGAVAAVAVGDGVLQPVFAAYAPGALDAFRSAPADAALTRTVDALGPVLVEMDARLVRSVDTEEDLARAEAELGLLGG
jgi:molybdopterin-guanine dinucleotide biosynthesis protein A